jgi:threonine/homoserine/homoserine lactone efflux protein
MSLRLHGFADFANYQLPEIGLWVRAQRWCSGAVLIGLGVRLALSDQR